MDRTRIRTLVMTHMCEHGVTRRSANFTGFSHPDMPGPVMCVECAIDVACSQFNSGVAALARNLSNDIENGLEKTMVEPKQ